MIRRSSQRSTRTSTQLAPVITARQISHGGPIILVQVENEYGAYGADKSYLAKLVDIYRGIGIDVPADHGRPAGRRHARRRQPAELHKTGILWLPD